MTKIMLVEDDKSLREIYSIRLVAEGYNIVSAGDGEEGLALAVQEKPDLIIADVMMPKISGFDMLDILRSTPETANVKVIMMTALSSEDQRQRGESLGANRYLVKSQVGIEDVINTVHELLGDKPNANAGANLDLAASIPTAAPTAPAAAPSAPATPAPTPTPAPAPAASTPTQPSNVPPVSVITPKPAATPVAAPITAPAAPAAPAPAAPAPAAPVAQPVQPANPVAAPVTTPATPVAPAPVAPVPVAPTPAAPVAQPVQPANPTTTPTQPGNPFAGTPTANFNQASVAMPTVPAGAQNFAATQVQAPEVAQTPSVSAASYTTPVVPQVMQAMPMPPAYQPAPMPQVVLPQGQSPAFMQATPAAQAPQVAQASAPLAGPTTGYITSSDLADDFASKYDEDGEDVIDPTQTAPNVAIPDRIEPNYELSAAVNASEAAAQATDAGPSVVPSKTIGGERVIKPLDSNFGEQKRDEMAAKMTEILGGDADDLPGEINTKSAKALKNEPPKLNVPTASEASAKIPEPKAVETAPTPVAVESQAPTPKPDGVADVPNPTPVASAAPEPKPEPSEPITHLEPAKPAETPKPKETPKAEEPKNDIAGQVEQSEKAEVQKVKERMEADADAEIAQREAAQLENEVVEPIQPGYITELAEELNEDEAKDSNKEGAEDANSISARMKAELQDDVVTLEAEKMRNAEKEQGAKLVNTNARIDSTEAFIGNNEGEGEGLLPSFLVATESNDNPNIHHDDEEEAEDDAGEENSGEKKVDTSDPLARPTEGEL